MTEPLTDQLRALAETIESMANRLSESRLGVARDLADSLYAAVGDIEHMLDALALDDALTAAEAHNLEATDA